MATATTSKDPLLDCLSLLCEWEERNFSARALTAGLPLVENRLTPTLFLRALERIGFHGQILQRTLTDITRADGPLVLILKNNQACIIKEIYTDNTAAVAFPHDKQPIKMPIKDLKNAYTGYAILIQSDLFFDERVEQFNPAHKESWFWSAILASRKLYKNVIIAAFLTNIFVLVIPIFIMVAYDKVLPNAATPTLWALAIGALIFFIFDLTVRILRHYYMDEAGDEADKILAHRLFQHLLGLNLAERPLSTGVFINHFNEYEFLRDFFTSATLIGLIDLPFIALFLIFIYLIGGIIVLIPLIAIPIVLLISWALERPARRYIAQALAGASQKQAVLVETLTGLETIKATVSESRLQHKWEQSVQSTRKAQDGSRFYTAFALNLTIFAQQITTIAIVIYGIYLILAGSMTVGGLIAVNILAGRAMMLGQVANLLIHFGRARSSLQTLNLIMALKSDKQYGKHYLHRPELKGDIEFKQVTFNYPKQKLPALDNINLKIKAGEKVGIIGRIGSGKSSLLKLIAGFYSPDKGILLVDNIDASQLDPTDLRHNAHYMSHESTLFFGSLYDNIAITSKHPTDEEVIEAARISGVSRFSERNPEGFSMPIGERGENLSPGQRQAIALARAIMAKPNIYLLDEPSAVVDSQFEQEFIQSFKPILGDKTLLLVTHRAAMLALVDRVIVMDNGKIIADGPKEQILKTLMEKLKQQQPKNETDI